ncbi:MAG: hypothetical protein Q4G51_15480 [Dermatophilus congolensis]|nr:hypothetical protein [Dermatophilus congolensis]
MANRNALIRQLVRLGITYGPIAYQGLLKNKGAVQELTRRQMHQRNHRAMAFEHAGQLIDGSVLPVFDGDTRVYVVFSGSAPVATHPVVRTPMDRLLAHYDLSRRLRPDAAGADIADEPPTRHIPPTPDRAGMWKQRLAGRGPLRRKPGKLSKPGKPMSSTQDSPARGFDDLPPVSDLPTVRRNATWPTEPPTQKNPPQR